MLKAVFVDWFGTLSESRFFEHWSTPDHPRRAHFDSLQEWWFDPASAPFLDDWLTGRRDVEAFVDAMAERWGLPRAEVEAELEAGFRHWTLLEPATAPLLAAIRKHGVRTVLATENVDACIRWAVPALGLGESFDAVLSSHALDALKHQVDAHGESRFFGAYLREQGIGPGESALIDDSAHLRDPVESWGIRFVHAPKGTGPGAALREILRELEAIEAGLEP